MSHAQPEGDARPSAQASRENGTRARWGSLTALLVWVWIAGLALPPPSVAASAVPDPDDGPAFGTYHPAYQGATLAHFLNPAMLGAQTGSGTCGWVAYRDHALEAWQVALRFGSLGVGYREHADAWEGGATGTASPDAFAHDPVRPRREVSVGYGLGEMPLLASGVLGHRVRYAWGEHADAWRWDIGLIWPVRTGLAISLVARDVAQDRLDGVLLRRSYQGGIVAGPLVEGLGVRLFAGVELLGTEKQRWVDEAILRGGLTVVHRTGAELRLVVDARPEDGKRDAILAVGLTVPFGSSQLTAGAARDRRAGAQQPRFGFGFVEERR